jgi:cobyric acid synthase
VIVVTICGGAGAMTKRLSDAELIQQLADQAKELGIEINLNYSFAQQSDE